MSTSFDTGNEVTIVGTKFAHDLFPDQELPTDGREVRSLRGNLIRIKGPNIMTAEICNLVLKHPFHTHTHTRLTALCPGLPGWASTRKVKPVWILLKQETVSGSGISWAICKSAPHSRQITMPAPHSPVFYRPDALPAAQPTVSKH